ncbi:co-chaperone GroES [bacterium]|nr:co-chaperone GroES [bacterium]MBR5945616.1 co-chaperone GroES [bacterium]MBR6462157.1 co-chaperone GroES [bacterium]
MKKIKPLSDHILVQRVESLSQKGGIFIPESAKEKPQEAKVIAVGPGKVEDGKRVPLEVKVGDQVLITKYGGTEITYNDEKYIILREEDVIAVID